MWTCFFYMGRFGGSTPKRHRLWSNDPDLLTSIAGRAGYMSKQEMEQCVFRTVRKYVDGNGVKRHVGNKEVLRESQCLCHLPYYVILFHAFVSQKQIVCLVSLETSRYHQHKKLCISASFIRLPPLFLLRLGYISKP